MPVRFQDQSLLHKPFINKFKKILNNQIKNSDFIMGENIKKFELAFAKYTNTKYSIAVSNGTDALTLAIDAIGLKAKDEVIIPAMTFISTALPLIHKNLNVKLCDIDYETGLMCLSDLKKKISPKTKCIIPVNFNGNYVLNENLKKILPNKIKIIFDSSQSHGSLDCIKCKNFKKKLCCGLGPKTNSDALISFYSLYPGKNLGALGDAGIITTNNKKIFNKICSLRNIGSIKKFFHNDIGYNHRMDNIQAGFLNEKIKFLDKQNMQRRKNAKYLSNSINNPKIKIVKHNKGSVYHNFVLLVKNRKKFIDYLNKKNIENNIHYPFSINQHKAIKKIIKYKKFKNAEKYAKNCISIPVHPMLTTNELIKMIKVINAFN